MSKIILALYVITTSLGLVVLKLGTKTGLPVSMTDGKVHVQINFYAVGGIILYGLSFVLYMYLISKHDLGYIIPLAASFVYILVFVASYFVFHEVFTSFKIIGIVLIIAGLVFLNLTK